MNTSQIEGSDIRTGDVIHFLNRPHLIDQIDPASDKTRALVDDPAARTARAGDWAITIHTGQYLPVTRVDTDGSPDTPTDMDRYTEDDLALRGAYEQVPS